MTSCCSRVFESLCCVSDLCINMEYKCIQYLLNHSSLDINVNRGRYRTNTFGRYVMHYESCLYPLEQKLTKCEDNEDKMKIKKIMKLLESKGGVIGCFTSYVITEDGHTIDSKHGEFKSFDHVEMYFNGKTKNKLQESNNSLKIQTGGFESSQLRYIQLEPSSIDNVSTPFKAEFQLRTFN